MAELEHRPIVHDHEAFLTRAHLRRGFQKAYDALETGYHVANERIAARARAGLTQHAVRQHAAALRQGPGLRTQD